MTARHRKKARTTDDNKCDIVDFKSSFKYYKRKQPPPSLDNVIDAEDEKWSEMLEQVDLIQSSSDDTGDHHTNKISDWKAFKIPSLDGLTIIKNILSVDDQHYWATQCLKVTM